MNAYLPAPACLSCLAANVELVEAGTEVPTGGPGATGPSAYTTEDRCGLCGSDRITYDAVELEIARTDAEPGEPDYGSAECDTAVNAAMAHLSEPADMIAVATALLDQAGITARKVEAACKAMGVERPAWMDALPKRAWRV